jgi:hypothetical protein
MRNVVRRPPQVAQLHPVIESTVCDTDSPAVGVEAKIPPVVVDDLEH